ncbi:hypothetical protein DFJ63DRAFT_138052 [Scheffersomyces coipomensis]|uniref:uncharacterized protein n=1 Tax=Scheffersomyces coipomensis TaxID=1788519 RepID=UPI00315D0E3F
MKLSMINQIPFKAKNYFSQPPLNYELYLKRIRRFPKLFKPLQDANQDKDRDTIDLALINAIKANRTLQTNNNTFPHEYRHTHDYYINDEVLNLKLNPTNLKLEQMLWNFLYNSPTNKSYFITNSSTIRTYLTTKPLPSNPKRLFDVTVSNFNSIVPKLYSIFKKIPPVDTSLTFTALQVLLEKKDYYNSIKLIDLTLNSPSYLTYLDKKFKYSIIYSTTVLSTITLLQAIYLPLLAPWIWLLINSVGFSGLFYGLFKLKVVQSVGRLSWRPYNSIYYNYLHSDEILAINKVITHLEEHNEINIKNYHHSKVRKFPNLNIFESNDYILELPSEKDQKNDEIELANFPPSTPQLPTSFKIDPESTNLQQFFKQELNKRKITLNDLPEELDFLQFWLTHGENFEWIEPDQDPAEIIKLDIKNKTTLEH